MSSLLPAGVDADTYARQVADAMVAAGWTDGPPPGLNPYGTVIHQGGVMVIMGPAHVPSRLSYDISGSAATPPTIATTARPSAVTSVLN